MRTSCKDMVWRSDLGAGRWEGGRAGGKKGGKAEGQAGKTGLLTETAWLGVGGRGQAAASGLASKAQ